MSQPKLRACAALITAAAAVLACAGPAVAVGVSPAEISQKAAPGDVIRVSQAVTTPRVPPKPDVVLLVDRTGSMGSAISNVKANMARVVASVKAAQPDAQFAIAEYCDFGDRLPAFDVVQNLTGDEAEVTAAVDRLALCDGGDFPESQLNALWQIGDGGKAIAFRPGSSRIVAWFGDASGHDPSGGHTEADATKALRGVDARVIAVSVEGNDLDATGQATRITAATGGSLLTGVDSSELSSRILDGLNNLPVTVTADPVCDPGLSIAFDPGSRTVTSGDTAVFGETITVATEAATTGTLSCRVAFALNGVPGGPEFAQTVRIDLTDTTAPAVSCPPGPNPAGNEDTGLDQDGYYRMVAVDDVDPVVGIYVRDTASGTRFGPYATGTTFKLTQAPGGQVAVKPFTGAVLAKFTLNGDAELTATDRSGNTGTAICRVAPAER